MRVQSIRNRYPKSRIRKRSKATSSRRNRGSTPNVVSCLAPTQAFQTPILRGIPTNFTIQDEMERAAQLAKTLIETRIGTVKTWNETRNPIDFIGKTLDKIALKLEGDLTTKYVSIYTSIEQEDEDDQLLSFQMEYRAYTLVILEPTISELAKIDKRLPVTFVDLIERSISKWSDYFNWQKAEEGIEFHMEMIEGDPDDRAQYEDLAEQLKTIKPDYAKQKTMGLREYRKIIKKMNEGNLKAILQQSLRLLKTSNEGSNYIDEEIYERYDGSPLFGVALVTKQYDQIDQRLEVETQYINESHRLPSVFARFDPKNASEVQNVFANYKAIWNTFQEFAQLIRIMPEQIQYE
jgi:hypothetical protein